MNAVGLTAMQMVLLRFIEREITEGRPPPSFTEMRDHLGLGSKSGIHRLITALVERGHLVRLANRARALALPGTPSELAMRQRAIRDQQTKLELENGKLQVGLQGPIANELLVFCGRKGANPSDVLVTALTEHMRGRP